MLSRANRATSYDLAHMGRGRAVRTRHLLLSYIPAQAGTDASAAVSKVGCSIAKKVAKRAVDRNLMKRRCRMAIRESFPLLATPILGIIRITDARASMTELRDEMQELFRSVR